jgi:DNA-binding SARP family transcriptional activator
VARLAIHLLGGLQVHAAGTAAPVAIAARKVQALLAYLAMHPGRALPRARLAALLWSDAGEAPSRASLRQALFVLRRALALGDDELVSGAGETIEWRAGVADVDALDFERLVDDGGDAALDRACALYGGPFLDAFDARAPAFDDWQATLRHRLHERAVDAMARRLAQHRASGDADRAVELALRLLAIDPLQEDVHAALMEVYAQLGRPVSALRQYRLCRDWLARELGVRPSARIEALREAIERAPHASARPVVAPAAPSDAGDPGGLEGAALRPVAIVCAEAAEAADEADPERQRALVERFAAIAGELAGRFGGTLQWPGGAQVSLLFGVPVAHGDDAERAAHCALRLREALPGLRIGVSAGTVLVTRTPNLSSRPFDLSGDTPAQAARLAAGARGGEVLLSDAAWQRLVPAGAQGDVVDRGPSAAAARRLAGFMPKAARSALVGRGAQLAQFASALQECARSGTGLCVHVRGEAGIGKTRLVEAFRALAVAQGFACHAGATLDFGTVAERDPVRAVVQSLLDGDDGAAADAVSRAGAEGLVDAPALPHLLELLHAPQPPSTRALFDAMDAPAHERGERAALVQLLQRAAARRPRLLVLEDLHWAPARTLAHAAAWAGACEHCAAVLVTTARGDATSRDGGWRGAHVTLDLGPLRWAEASALAAQFGDASDGFALRCIERSGGHPLFLEQLLLGGRDGGEALPGSVLSVVQARLDRLAAAERHAVRVASVLGQRFALAALDHLLDGAGWDVQRTQALVSVDGRDGAFAHALVAEAAHASLPRSQRQALHAKAAAWFAGRDATLHAQHLDRADDGRAAQAYLAAAQLEAAAHRHERALPLAERGLALAGDGPLAFALAACRADVLHDRGAMAEAHVAYADALAAARDDAQRCRARLGLAAVDRVRDRLDDAMHVLDEAERAALALRHPELLARIHHLRGNLRFPRGDVEGALRAHEQALACAREAASVELEAAALGGVGDVRFMQGRMRSAFECFGQGVALARQHGLPRVEAANRPMAAFARWYAGDADGALDDALAAIALAQAIGHRRAEAIAQHAAYQFHHARAAFDAARAHADRALALARELSAPRLEAEALAFVGEWLRTTGDADAAVEALQAALALARSHGLPYIGPMILGMLAAAANDGALRRDALAEGEALLERNTLAHNHFLFRRDAMQAGLQAEDWAAVDRHADALLASARDEPLPWCDFFAARGRALSAWGRGSRDAATREALREVEAQGRRIGQPVWLASMATGAD